MATQIHGKIQFVDLNGVPLNGGKVYVYEPGTTTDKVSYTVPAATGGTENTQPVVLNARGEANIYVVGDCKITVTDSLDNLIYTLDNIKDLSGEFAASSGSSLVGFIQSGTGAVATTLQDKLRLYKVDGADFSNFADLLTAKRTARRVIDLKDTLETISSTITIDNLGANADNGIIIRGSGWNLTSATNSSGFDGTGMTTPMLSFNGSVPYNNDAPYVFEDFAVVGSSTWQSSGGSQDGFIGRANNLFINRLLVQYMNGHGVNLNQSFSSMLNGGLYYGNYKNGIHAVSNNNRFVFRGMAAFTNGRDYTVSSQANMYIDGGYGPIIDNVDVSYSGKIDWLYSDGSLTSVSVTSGVCTVTTTANHGRTTGDYIGIKLTGDANLDNDFPAQITVTGLTTFTFVTNAADGSYVAADTNIGTYSNGLYAIRCEGILVTGFYCENALGLAAYFGECNGVTINGGFIYNSKIYIDSSNQNVEIGGIKFMGIGGLKTVEANDRATINVKSNNYFIDGATWVHTSFYMLDGVRYGPNIPTTGTWERGDILHNSNIQGGGVTSAWVCTVAGTPGTWIPLDQIPEVYPNWGDANGTLTPYTTYQSNYWLSPLTADRSVTLITTGAVSGTKFRITRTAAATGAYNLNVGTGPLKSLGVGTWCDVEYNGTTWILSAYGSL